MEYIDILRTIQKEISKVESYINLTRKNKVEFIMVFRSKFSQVLKDKVNTLHNINEEERDIKATYLNKKTINDENINNFFLLSKASVIEYDLNNPLETHRNKIKTDESNEIDISNKEHQKDKTERTRRISVVDSDEVSYNKAYVESIESNEIKYKADILKIKRNLEIEIKKVEKEFSFEEEIEKLAEISSDRKNEINEYKNKINIKRKKIFNKVNKLQNDYILEKKNLSIQYNDITFKQSTEKYEKDEKFINMKLEINSRFDQKDVKNKHHIEMVKKQNLLKYLEIEKNHMLVLKNIEKEYVEYIINEKNIINNLKSESMTKIANTKRQMNLKTFEYTMNLINLYRNEVRDKANNEFCTNSNLILESLVLVNSAIYTLLSSYLEEVNLNDNKDIEEYMKLLANETFNNDTTKKIESLNSEIDNYIKVRNLQNEKLKISVKELSNKFTNDLNDFTQRFNLVLNEIKDIDYKKTLVFSNLYGSYEKLGVDQVEGIINNDLKLMNEEIKKSIDEINDIQNNIINDMKVINNDYISKVSEIKKSNQEAEIKLKNSIVMIENNLNDKKLNNSNIMSKQILSAKEIYKKNILTINKTYNEEIKKCKLEYKEKIKALT